MYLLYFAIAIAQCYDLSIKMGPVEGDSRIYTVYDRTLHEQFNPNQLQSSSCSPLTLQTFKAATSTYNLTTPIIIQSYSERLTIDRFQIKVVDPQRLNLSSQFNFTQISPGNPGTIMISYKCPKNVTKLNYWGIVVGSISFQNQSEEIEFAYQFLCDQLYHPNRFDWSYVIMVIIISLSLLILVRQQHIQSIKIIFRTKTKSAHLPSMISDDHVFQGIFLNYKYALIYIASVLGLFLGATVFKSKIQILEEYGVRSLTLIAGYLLINEILYNIKILRCRILWKIRVLDLISTTISIMTYYFYVQKDEAWMLSDILTIFLIGASIKLFKITSLKNAVSFFIPSIIFDISLSLYASYNYRYEWDGLLLKYFNTALSAQMPYFQGIYKKKCGWISVVSILFPAFMLAYSYRFDVSQDIRIYQTISFTGLLIGLLSWFTLTSIYSLPLPVSIFTIIPILSMTALFAYQRHEISSFWNGYFYDAIILDPFSKLQRFSESQSSVASVKIPLMGVQDIELNEVKSSNKLVTKINGRLQISEDLFKDLNV